MTDKPWVPAPWGEARPITQYPAHEARERAIRILTDAYAYDAISEVEFERRLVRLSETTTGAAIGAIVADLPVMGTVQVESPHPLLPTPRSRIAGFMSEVHRTGPWMVPQALTIRAVMCSMTVDLCYAVIPSACTIEVQSVMSTVLILVSPGLTVEFDVQPYLASVGSNAPGGSREGRVEAHMRIVGTAVMSDVRVRQR